MENEFNEEVVNDETSNGDVETPENNEEQNPENDNTLKTLQAQKEHWKKKYEELKSKSETKTESNKTNQNSSEPDYAKLAFLEQRGLDHPDDQKLVMEEAERLKLPLIDVLGMKHMQSQIADNKNQRKAEAGMPKGKGSNNSNTKADVDYWLAKGETPSDPDLAEKVINARMQKEQQASKFSDELYSG